jgi:uncharacterized repeat protein (TIGR03803 family)
VTPVAGRFYGTTHFGGAGSTDPGTVFDVREDGTERVLHSFTDPSDGRIPLGGLTRAVDTITRGYDSLFGTTGYGGKNGNGTVYELKTDGSAYRVVYNFKDAPDGKTPDGNLTTLANAADVLYGTTHEGGENLKGTVFELHDGSERVLYSFTGTPDGESPVGDLNPLGLTLYGTTAVGGANDLGCVFTVNAAVGGERVLYSFKGSKSGDGATPSAGLAVLSNNVRLYGVTREGGADNDGTVFEIQTDGTERVIHSFKGSDGRSPAARLTVLNGVMYGTTDRGGEKDLGTIFEVHSDGAFRVLHSFSGTDGSYPEAKLAISDGDALVGTTRYGGTRDAGTVFRVQL